MKMSVKEAFVLVFCVSILVFMFGACSGGGVGSGTVTSSTDFPINAVVPGYVLQDPSHGRADVTSSGTYDAASEEWTVILSRKLKPTPKDTRFSFAITEDSHNHVGASNLLLDFDGTTPTSSTVISKRITNDGITLDGQIDVNDAWASEDFSEIDATAMSNLPAGEYPTAIETTIQMGSVYDDKYVYFVVRWKDQGGNDGLGDRSDRNKEQLYDGAEFTTRAHRGNDMDGDGTLDVNLYSGSESEDRVFFMFPINDSEDNYSTATSGGCATYCHSGNATMSTNVDGDKVDIWHWKAARTAPAGFADDKHLKYAADEGNGRTSDTGTGIYGTTGTTWMYDSSHTASAGYIPLISEAIDFADWTLAGYTAPTTINPNVMAHNEANFNNTGGAPTVWDGTYRDNFLPKYYMKKPSMDRGDVNARSTYTSGWWIVEFRRARLTVDAMGIPSSNDVQFEDDADFHYGAYLKTDVSVDKGLVFSVAVFDNAGGNSSRKTKYVGPYFLTADTTAGTATSTEYLELVDYGAGFAPTSASDFTDTAMLIPGTPDEGADVGLWLKAGTDGGDNIFIIAQWSDSTESIHKSQWSYNGSVWSRNSANEDRFAFVWNINIPDTKVVDGNAAETIDAAFVGRGGCAILCHTDGYMRADAVGEVADLWHWKAARGNDIGFADDKYFPYLTHEGEGDFGDEAYFSNVNSAGDGPKYYSMSGYDADPDFLYINVAGVTDTAAVIPTSTTGGDSSTSFSTVQAILDADCVSCHGSAGGLDLSTYAGIKAGGNGGAAVVAGSSSSSLLIKRMNGTEPPVMPLNQDALSSADIQTISDWIDAGAENN